MSYNKRSEYNKKIIEILITYLDTTKDMRFGQALVNLGLNSIDWNEESSKTYNKLIDLICKHYKLKG